MIDRVQEAERLAQAQAKVEEGERRVSEQVTLLEQLRTNGGDTLAAEMVLRASEATVETWRLLRDRIVRSMGWMDGGLA